MLDIFIMTEQPTTCSKCGTRVEILAEFKMDNLQTQFCRCGYTGCQFIFIEQEDDYFSIDYWCRENRD